MLGRGDLLAKGNKRDQRMGYVSFSSRVTVLLLTDCNEWKCSKNTLYLVIRMFVALTYVLEFIDLTCVLLFIEQVIQCVVIIGWL